MHENLMDGTERLRMWQCDKNGIDNWGAERHREGDGEVAGSGGEIKLFKEMMMA